uniref:USP domain-containing protein n=1 Tax=Ditylum brightwellii TaxID=49249 RepID=A0A7S4V831_9STRA
MKNYEYVSICTFIQLIDIRQTLIFSGSVIHSMEEQFKKPELLSEKEGNGWRPEKGADKVDALKGSLLRAQGLPSLLQLHLKRFRYDWQTDVMSKINDKFEFPEELDLSEVCTDVEKEEEERTIYDLQSIVVHVGEFGSGKYRKSWIDLF